MEANGPVCVGAPEWLRGRRGASLAIALMAVLAATLIGSALVASTGNMGAKAHQELQKQKSMALAEASLELALQHRLTSQAGSSMAFRMPGAPQALQVDIDTTGLWWKARVDCGSPLGCAMGSELMSLPDTTVYGQGVLLTNGNDSLRVLRIARAIGRFAAQQWRFTVPVGWGRSDSLENGCALSGNRIWWNAGEVPACPLLRLSQGDFTLMDSRDDPGPKANLALPALVVDGAVTIRSDSEIDTLRIFAQGDVRIEGRANIQWAEIHSLASITVSGDVRMRGILSGSDAVVLRERVRAQDGALLLARRLVSLEDQSQLAGHALAVRAGTLGQSANVSLGALTQTSGLVFAEDSLFGNGDVRGTTVSRYVDYGIRCYTDNADKEWMQYPGLDFGGPRRLVSFHRRWLRP